MDRKAEIILKRTEKAGIRKSLKEGHALNEQELLSLKVQIVPAHWRIAMALSAIGTGIGGYVCWQQNSPVWGPVLAVLALLLLLFSIHRDRQIAKNLLAWRVCRGRIGA